ncbi:MAG TPA: hypothetical protein VK789_28995 [Bryobacteraceae bacterium]|nr:hypothetical protein [Bryobacteraceae bacterium]
MKLGIHQLDQYYSGTAPDWRAALRTALSRNRIAFTLLRTTVPPTVKQIALFENTIPQLCLSSGVYRTTYRGRFRNFDPLLNERLAERFGRSAPLRIEDWAASDCLASSEWTASLFPMFPLATLTASDLTLFLIEVCVPDGSTYIMEANGELLQYIQPPFVIRLNPPESRFLPVNSLLERGARLRFRPLKQSWRIPSEWLNSECPEVFEQPPFVFRKIPLIHPEAQALRVSCSRFAIRRHSVFESSDGLPDVIRTMNIFNHSYFSKERMLEGARAVAQSLREGGLWIVGRTMQENPPVHHASLLVREKDGFRLIERFGPGSEIEELVVTGLPA